MKIAKQLAENILDNKMILFVVILLTYDDSRIFSKLNSH